MAELPFVDTHVHFSDLRQEQLTYVWLEPEFVHPVLGDIGAIQAQRYWADDFVRETRFANRPQVGPRAGRPGHRRSGRGDEVAAGLRRPPGPSARHRRRGPPGAARRCRGHRSAHAATPTFVACATSGQGTTPADRDLASRASPTSSSTTWWPALTRRPRPTPASRASRKPSPTSSSRSTMPASPVPARR